METTTCQVCDHNSLYSQQYVQITRRHKFDRHPDVGLLLTLVRIVVC